MPGWEKGGNAPRTTMSYYVYVHPRKLTCPLKRCYLGNKEIHFPTIDFQGHVRFPGEYTHTHYIYIHRKYVTCMLRDLMSCHVMSCHVMLCYVILYYIV